MGSHWNDGLISTIYHLHQRSVRPELYQVIKLKAIVNEDEAVSTVRQPTAQVFQLVSTEIQLWMNGEVVVATTLTELDKNISQFVSIVLVIITCHYKYVIVICAHNNTVNG